MGELLGAVTYGRQSLGKDTSIEQQLEAGRKRVAGEGWHHHAEYSDRVSASRYSTKTRDDWAKLLRDLERLDVHRLWLWESSRGDRTLSSWAAMLERCRDHKVQIYVETHGRVYDVANGRDWRTLAEDGVDSAYESEKISSRTKRSADARAAEGRPHSGAGYGYRNLHDERTGKFTERVVEPVEAAKIRELFSRIKKGHSLRAVERDWDARGIRTRSGRRFSSQYLRHLAMTAAYAGLRVHLSTEERKAGPYRLDGATEGTWEPIVDLETFYAVRETLTRPERKTTRPGRAVHLLSVTSAAVCDVCSGPLTASDRLSGSAYRTGSTERRWMYSCLKAGHVRVDEAELDLVAERAILSYLSREDNYSAFTKPADGPELERVRGEIKAVQTARADLADAVTRRGKSPAWALAADDEFARQLAVLGARERELTAPDELAGLIEPGADVAARWAGMPVSARRQVARIVLAADRMGVIRVLRTKSGTRVPAADRVNWVRE